jgi:hypothetical protein
MEPRRLTAADREVQILALWRGRAPARRSREDVAPFYQWLIEYAPWLLPAGGGTIDDVRSVVEAHTISADELQDSVAKARRRRLPGRATSPRTDKDE